MWNYRPYILLVFSFFILQGVKAQQNLHYFFRHINQSDGLLHNQVASITQDGRGFIWIVTFNGLQRYDGSRFNYYPDMLSDHMGGLTSVADMYADKKNDFLWILKNAEVERMKFSNNHCTIYNSESVSKDSTFTFNTYTDINNEQWQFGSNTRNQLKVIKHKNDLPIFNITTGDVYQNYLIATDKAGNTWFPIGKQLIMFDKASGRIHSDKFNPGHHPLLDSSFFNGSSLRFVMIDSRQNTWITTWGNLFFKYDHITKKISRYSLSDIKSKEGNSKTSETSLLISCMLEDNNHSIWLGTENAGLLRYNENSDQFDFCITADIKKESIAYNYKIFCLFQDRENNIWVGTDKGINIFNPYRRSFHIIKHEENNPFSISKNEIQSFIQASNGDMFLGTWGAGIAVYDSSFNFKKNIAFAGESEKNYAWSFLQADDRTIWMGCQFGYIVMYDIISGKEKTLHPPEMQGHTIRCMEKDNNGNIWCGLQNGMIIKWDKQLNKFLPYGNEQQADFNRTVSVSAIFIDQLQHCWVSTKNGFREFDLKKRIYVNTWLPDKNDPASISGNTCEGIEAFNDSILLIGTIYGGLNFFNIRTKTFTHWNTSNGLPSNTIYAIKKDTAGYIWFTTDYGLYKFNSVEKKIIPYGMEPGVINASFVSNKFYPLQNGNWLTYTAAEAISFFSGITENNQTIKLKTEITGFKLFDAPVFIDSLLYGHKPVKLSYKENFFTIEFAALDYSGMGQINYSYQLTGVDKDWVNGGIKRYANYTDLQPGEYNFLVKSENGNSKGEITSFKIIIAPPFWRTWWFISAFIAVVVFSVYWLFRRRVNAIHHEAQMKQTIAETEMMALRAQMNPHFIFNCLNSIDNLIQTDQKEKATNYLAKFARLIRAILENSKNNTIPCWKDLEALKLYLQMEELRWDKKITCSVVISNEIQNGDYKVPPMVVQPFVENAIHHGLLSKIAPDKKLAIDVKLEGNKIKYTITDNGVGRLKAGEYKKLNRSSGASLGMQITKDRINLFNQDDNGSVKITDLYNDLQQADGTMVEVWLTTQPLTT